MDIGKIQIQYKYKYLGYWKNTASLPPGFPCSKECRLAPSLQICSLFWYIYFSFNFLLALFHPFLGISFYRRDVWPAELLWKGTFRTEGETRKTFMDWNLNANILVLTLIHNIFQIVLMKQIAGRKKLILLIGPDISHTCCFYQCWKDVNKFNKPRRPFQKD